MRIKTLILTALIVTLFSTPQFPTVEAQSWSTPERITSSPALDWFPSITQAQDGKVWVVWQNHSADSSNIHRTTYQGSSWGPSDPVVIHQSQDATPRLALMNNGSQILVWASDRTGNPDIFYKTWDPSGWSSENQLTLASDPDQFPAVLAARDGRLWVVWQRRDSTSNYDLYYQTYQYGSWASEQRLTFDPGRDLMPSMAETWDGRIFVVWNSDRSGDGDIYYKSFNGVAWSGETRLTTSTQAEKEPVILQDITGKLWVIWARELPVVPEDSQWDLYHATSTDGGVAWSTEAAVVPSSYSNEDEPATAFVSDGRIWLVYRSDIIAGNSEVYLTTTSLPQILHDISIRAVTGSRDFAHVGISSQPTTVNVTIVNHGSYSETTTLSVKANGTIVASQTLTINPGQTIVTGLDWNTTFTIPGHYVLSAEASQASEEVNTANNVMMSHDLFHARIAGDVDADGDVDLDDLIGVYLNQFIATMPSVYDIDNDQDVDLDDLITTYTRQFASRDIAVSEFTVSRGFAYVGIIAQPIKLNATVVNLSSSSETTTLSIKANGTIVATRPLTLNGGQTIVVSFDWNTTLTAPGHYILSAEVSQVPGEINTANNILSHPELFHARKAGDVDSDSDVDLDDVIAVFLNQFIATMPSVYDIDNDQDVDLDDLIITFTHQFT